MWCAFTTPSTIRLLCSAYTTFFFVFCRQGSNSTFYTDSLGDVSSGTEDGLTLNNGSDHVMTRDSGFSDRACESINFNNLSYEDYELKTTSNSRSGVESELNIATEESKEVNVDPTPPPIPPKNTTNERRESLDNSTATPNENYSVPRLHTAQKQ